MERVERTDAVWEVAFGAMAMLAVVAVVPLLVAVDGGAAIGRVQAFRLATTEAVRGALPWPLAHPLAEWTRHVLLAPHLFLPFALILLLERTAPADPAQRLVSPALVNDFFWYLATIGVVFAVNARYTAALQGLYDAHLGFLTIGALASLPEWCRIVVGAVVSDFLDWVHHFVRHKVPACWWFHSVHHAQRTTNAWTAERIHMVEYFVKTGIRFVPVAALGVTTPGIAAYALAVAWYTRLYHANIRSNFGVLRFVLVTPQSHRIHHSERPEHRDTNFGVVLCVWDRLFGTQSPDDQSYPETGIADATFPQERRWADALSLRAFLAQQLYPFRLAGRWARRVASGA
jgi:sterol desaturase/sphingolipid hydroxylase (fatty acid hydroxylase superfamily)